MSETRDRLSAALRSMRMRRAMRHDDLATASGLPLRTVKAILSGERDCSWDRIDALCRGLGCSVAQLLALAASADESAT
jgi:DNA-binding Xre family transcriptional regulator